MDCHSQQILNGPCSSARVGIRGTLLNGSGNYEPNYLDELTVTGETTLYCLTLQFLFNHKGAGVYYPYVNGVRSGAGFQSDIHIEYVICNHAVTPTPQCIGSKSVPLNPCDAVHTIVAGGILLSGNGQFIEGSQSYQLTGRHQNFNFETRAHPFGFYQNQQLVEMFINGNSVSGAGFKCGADVISISTVCAENCTDCCRQLLPIARGINI